jgi:hypothetical protein
MSFVIWVGTFLTLFLSTNIVLHCVCHNHKVGTHIHIDRVTISIRAQTKSTRQSFWNIGRVNTSKRRIYFFNFQTLSFPFCSSSFIMAAAFEYVKLNNGLRMPLIGLGTWQVWIFNFNFDQIVRGGISKSVYYVTYDSEGRPTTTPGPRYLYSPLYLICIFALRVWFRARGKMNLLQNARVLHT